MLAHTRTRRKNSGIQGFILQALIAGIFVGLFLLAVGSVMVAAAADPRSKSDEEHSWLRQVIEMSILGAEASEHGSQSGSTG